MALVNQEIDDIEFINKIKDMVNVQSVYNLGRREKSDSLFYAWVMNRTNQFPSTITFSKRIRAIAEGNECKCSICGTVHGDIDLDFCSRICKTAYKKQKGKNFTFDEIMCRIKGYSDKEIIPEERPSVDFCPTEKDKFVTAYNKINSLTDEELENILDNFNKDTTPKHIRHNRIRRLCIFLIKIATHNVGITDYFEQVTKCAKFPNKTDNLEYCTLLYGEDYANYKMSKKSERVKGKNNPAYGHGGKFSPFSKKFIKGDVVDETAKKAADSRNKNNTNITRLSYWTERYGQEEGERLYYERQNTFSLEKLINKHGEKEGTRRWKERQEKWQDTLSHLPEEQRILINAKKGFWKYTDPLTNDMDDNDPYNDIDTILYVIEYSPVNTGEIYIKIGVTCKSVYKRFSHIEIQRVLETHVADRYTNFTRERDIKKYIFQNNLNILIETEQDKFDGWTECVDITHKDKILLEVNNVIKNYPSNI